jgi:hypothetical protein
VITGSGDEFRQTALFPLIVAVGNGFTVIKIELIIASHPSEFFSLT